MKSYEKHIIKPPMFNDTEAYSYCGELIGAAIKGEAKVQEWCFVNTDHALKALENNDRLLPCPKCRQKVIDLLHSN